MRTTFTIMTLVSLSSLVACATGDDPEVGDDSAAVVESIVAAGTPTLACNLEYEKFTPFTVRPVASFRVPFSQVQAQGVTATDGHYQISAFVNPAPPANLSFQVGISNVQTGKDTATLVLPTPQAQGAFLFENNARISPVTKAGILFDHVRAFCSFTIAP